MGDNDGLFTDDDNDNYDEGDDFLNENGDSDEMDAHQGEVEVGREDNGFFTDDEDNLEQASDENFIEEESSGLQGEFLDRDDLFETEEEKEKEVENILEQEGETIEEMGNFEHYQELTREKLQNLEVVDDARDTSQTNDLSPVHENENEDDDYSSYGSENIDENDNGSEGSIFEIEDDQIVIERYESEAQSNNPSPDRFTTNKDTEETVDASDNPQNLSDNEATTK